MITKTPEHFTEEISTVAAAEKYELTPSYLARLARTQIIRAYKFGRDWILDEEALRTYLAQPRKPGPKPHVQKEHALTNSGEVSLHTEGNRHAAAKGYAG